MVEKRKKRDNCKMTNLSAKYCQNQFLFVILQSNPRLAMKDVGYRAFRWNYPNSRTSEKSGKG